MIISHRLTAALAFLFVFASQAQATQVCGWMVEANAPDDVRNVDIWLQADGHVEFFYKIGGEGISSEGEKAHSPGSGTYILDAGKADRPWGFGTTLYPPSKIDITIELHKIPADIFSDAPTPLLAQFTFRRDVPASETKPPAT